MTSKENLQHIIDQKTKPPGSLGRLEDLALQIGWIQKTERPSIINPHIVVFAADHGIAATGLVNPYPQAVTAQMVYNFLNGGAAINVFCRLHSIALTVVDAGVCHDWNESVIASSEFIRAGIAKGTANYLEGTAMTEAQCEEAIEKGREVVRNIRAGGCNTIGFGEMGIGNTSSASLIMSAMTGCSVAEAVGRGTGVNDAQLQTKKEVLERVAAFHGISELKKEPLQLLRCVGGFEIAMMCGAYLQAAQEKMVIVVDGFIATAALLLTQSLDRQVLDHCIFAHTSGEQGHQRMLDYLDAKPLLQLGLRLGEGTGAALAMTLIRSAVAFLNEMASFEAAGVSEKLK